MWRVSVRPTGTMIRKYWIFIYISQHKQFYCHLFRSYLYLPLWKVYNSIFSEFCIRCIYILYIVVTGQWVSIIFTCSIQLCKMNSDSFFLLSLSPPASVSRLISLYMFFWTVYIIDRFSIRRQIGCDLTLAHDLYWLINYNKMTINAQNPNQ